MSYRVTDVNFDPEREDEFYAYADGLRDQLKAVDGLQLVHVIDVDKGQSVFIARYDNEESAVAANETIQGILAEEAVQYHGSGKDKLCILDSDSSVRVTRNDLSDFLVFFSKFYYSSAG